MLDCHLEELHHIVFRETRRELRLARMLRRVDVAIVDVLPTAGGIPLIKGELELRD